MAGFPGVDMSGMTGSPTFQGGNAGPATSGQNYGSTFNSSGWTVNTGTGTATGGIPQWLLIGGAIFAAVMLWKKR